MTSERRLQILEEIKHLKTLYQIHKDRKMIEDEFERTEYLMSIIDAIQELEKALKESLDRN